MHVLNCRVVTPTEELLSEPITHAQIPAWDGLFGVLPGHAPFVAELGIGEHETTPDGKYSLMTEECLAGCDHAPCMLINEKLHKCVRAADVPRLLADADNDKVSMPRSDLFDAPEGSTSADDAGDLEQTSDVSEMRDAE